MDKPALISSAALNADKSSPCWMNGVLVPQDQAKVSAFDHGLLYWMAFKALVLAS